jgi:hypothetical protein
MTDNEKNYCDKNLIMVRVRVRVRIIGARVIRVWVIIPGNLTLKLTPNPNTNHIHGNLQNIKMSELFLSPSCDAVSEEGGQAVGLHIHQRDEIAGRDEEDPQVTVALFLIRISRPEKDYCPAKDSSSQTEGHTVQVVEHSYPDVFSVDDYRDHD